MQKKYAAFLLFFFLIMPGMVPAQDYFPGGTYNSAVPKLGDVLNHQWGEQLTFHWELEKYLATVEKASDRIIVNTYGQTYENRNLYYVIISSPENLVRLEEIRTANLRLTDPVNTSEAEAKEIAGWMPSVVWLGYNIHGNETSAMEAAIQTIYQLAAGTDEKTLNILKNVVCIIDPLQNPDGHDRYVSYVRSVVTSNSHPQRLDVEHSGPWPGGRTNHYLFDLNRDFFLKTQIESQGKAVIFQKWRPHVFADLHEMGSNATYFFAPPMTPYNEFVKPELAKWWEIIGRNNAKAFDRFGWGYYTKESFDAFYPGYGTSYPSINGAVGMTYEQASANGLSIRRNDKTVLTLKEGAWHHFTTSMATLDVVAWRRAEKVIDFYKTFQHALKEAATDPLKEIILVPGHDPLTTAKLVNNLLVENVRISRAAESFTCKSAVSYMGKVTESRTFPAGSYIIRLDQPQRILIKALLAPESPLNPEFIKKEEERKKNKESSHFYDVTAWSMPLTYGVETWWTEDYSKVKTDPVTKQVTYMGGVLDSPAKQAYLVPFNTVASSKLLSILLREGYRVRIAGKPFTIDGKWWEKGTLVIRVNRNPESIHTRLAELARQLGITITALNSGYSDKGIDLGSGNIRSIISPKIALLTEPPVAAYSYGTIHFLFERVFDTEFTRLSAKNIGRLNEFNVLVLPSGNYRNFFSKQQLAAFREWIRSGGTVVSVSGATGWLREDTVKISRLKRLNDMPDPKDKKKKIKVDRTAGAIVKVNLDSRSFLSFGSPSSVAALVRSSVLYLPFEDNELKNVGTFAPYEKLRLSGFIWPETEKLMPGKGYLYEESFGRGKLILFTEDPVFRASYDGLEKLFMNAVLLGPSF